MLETMSSVAPYMYWRLRNMNEGECESLTKRLIDEDDMSPEKAASEIKRFKSLSFERFANDELITALEAEWIDDYQSSFNDYIANSLKNMSDSELMSLAETMANDPIECDVYEVDNKEEAFTFIKKMQSSYDTRTNDTQFFEEQFEPSFITYLKM